MNLKETAYRAAKAALVAGAAVLSGTLADGLPTSKSALFALSAAMVIGGAHGALNVIEQSLGFTVYKKSDAPPAP